ncbi:hypothetical protein P280DRAFT_469786 [Massarina eburnea CBS 473.64]|uniref:Uncharacterized protein n=1 Tax=Massarina eburnea CBS 473.64 TaxID=1395130 RepID=A0A6A6S1H5_9PLEO|nr:hypothetical protein P280DRAFT_469786 [Massarina eburnea CBS 473.64]
MREVSKCEKMIICLSQKPASSVINPSLSLSRTKSKHRSTTPSVDKQVPETQKPP